MKKSQGNDSPFVSVVMPVYNGAKTLWESIDSVLRQTYQNFELIICNDASTDETWNILDKFSDDRIRVIQNSRNIGPGSSRDRAIEIAKGAWIAVIDSDDKWRPDRLETLIRLAADIGTDKIIFDDIMRCHDTPSGMIPWRPLRGKYAFGTNGTNAVQVPVEKYICSNSLLIKPLLPLSHIRQHNVHHSSIRYGEDSEFFLKLLSFGLRLYYLPKPMYNYRITPASQSAAPERYPMMFEVIENSIDFFKQQPNIQGALRIKLIMEKRKEAYLPLIISLKRKDFLKTFKLLYQSPWIIHDSIPRIIRALAYHTHRISHHGHIRGTRDK